MTMIQSLAPPSFAHHESQGVLLMLQQIRVKGCMKNSNMRQIIATQLFEIIQLNYLLSFNQQQ
jgi:hypothetical protein